MTGIFVSRAPAGRPRCARCHRPFTPKHEGDRYGPTCARKIAGKPDPECQVDPDVCPGDCGHGVDDRLNLDDIAETGHTVIV